MRRAVVVALAVSMVTVGLPVAATGWTADPVAATAPASPAIAEPPELPRRLLDDPAADRDRTDRAPLTTRLAEAAADGPLSLETLRDRVAVDRELPEPDDGNRSRPSVPAIRDRLEAERDRLLRAAKAPAAPPSAEADHESHCGYRVPHPPIEITEDEGPSGFVVGHEPVTGQPIYRPGSGVIAGTGTADDPYVIAHWCIGARGVPEDADTALVGIEIRDTTAHVVIGNVGVRMPEDDAIGVRLDDADNVTLRRSDVRGGDLGVAAVSARDVSLEWNTVAGSRLAGVGIADSPKVRVRHNTLEPDGGTGVLVFSSSDATLDGNLVRRGAEVGILVTGTPSVRMTRNQVDGGFPAIAVGGSPDARLTDNEVERVYYGLVAWDSDGVQVDDNVFRDGGDLAVFDSDGARIRDNELDDDLVVRGSNRSRIVGNVILNSGGYLLTGALDVEDARDVTIADNTVVAEDRYYVTGIRVVETNVTRIRENTVRVEAGVFSFGVTSYGAENLLVEGNTVDQDGDAYVAAGMVVGGADAPRIRRNTVRDSADAGIVLAEVEQATLADNDVEGSAEVAIELYRSGDNTLEDNRLVGAGLRIEGGWLDDYIQAAVTGNTVNGEPLRYIEGATNVTVPEPVGQAILVDVSGARIADLGISDATVAIHAVYSDDVAIDNVTLGDNLYGILGRYLRDVSVTRTDVGNSSEAGIHLQVGGRLDATDNRVAESGDAGIVATGPANATVARNRVVGAGFDGIRVRSAEADIVDNRVRDARDGIEAEAIGGFEISGNHLVDAALTLDGSPDNVVANNTIVRGGLEIRADGPAGWSQTVIGNTVNGEPLRYIADATGFVVSEPVGQVVLVNVSDARVVDLTLSDATVGVQAADSRNVTVRGSDLTGNEAGVVAHRLDGARIVDNVGAGTVVRDANRTSIAHNEYTGRRYGVIASGSHRIRIADNAMTPDGGLGVGAHVDDTSRVEIADNDVEVAGVYSAGIVVHGSQDVDLLSNDVVGGEGDVTSGIFLGSVRRALIADSTVRGTAHGVTLAAGSEIEVRDTVVEDVAWTGVETGWYFLDEPLEDIRIHHNRIVDARYGIDGGEGVDVEIVANEVTRSTRLGIYANGDPLIEDNNIWDNDRGLYTATRVTAEHNWWGCPAGPPSPTCDDVGSDPAGGPVDYVPWRATANGAAGPR